MSNQQIEDKLHEELSKNITAKILFNALIDELERQGNMNPHAIVYEIYAEQIGEEYNIED